MINLRLYLCFARSGEFVREHPASSMREAWVEAREKDPRIATVYLKTPANAHEAVYPEPRAFAGHLRAYRPRPLHTVGTHWGSLRKAKGKAKAGGVK